MQIVSDITEGETQPCVGGIGEKGQELKVRKAEYRVQELTVQEQKGRHTKVEALWPGEGGKGEALCPNQQMTSFWPFSFS